MWLLLGQLWHKIGLLFIPKSGPTGKTILFCQELSVQCDQIGRFLEFLDHEFYYKSRPNVWWLFGQLRNPSLFKSNWLRYILGNFLKNLGYFLFQNLVIDVIKNGNLSSIFSTKALSASIWSIMCEWNRVQSDVILIRMFLKLGDDLTLIVTN